MLQISKILNINEINKQDYNNLHSKIEIIKNDNRVNRKIIDNLFTLKNVTNEFSHYNQNVIYNFSILHYLLLLVEILFYFKDHKLEMFNHKEFDQTYYSQLDKNYQISAMKKKNNDYNESFVIEMVSTKDIFINFKSNILIPIYQRKYTWDDEQIKMLIDDIDQNIKNNNNGVVNHYMGAIACKLSKYNNKDVIKIIDGQQRITTSLLFICAIRDLLCVNHHEQELKQEYKWIYENLENFLLSPFIFENDNECFSKLIKYDQAYTSSLNKQNFIE